MKEGMCILINEFWKDSGAGSTGCTPVYSSGKTASGDKLEDLDAETPYNLFDYYAVSNGDAFNDQHNPGYPGSDNEYITAEKAKNEGNNPYTSEPRIMGVSEFQKHGVALTKQ